MGGILRTMEEERDGFSRQVQVLVSALDESSKHHKSLISSLVDAIKQREITHCKLERALREQNQKVRLVVPAGPDPGREVENRSPRDVCVSSSNTGRREIGQRRPEDTDISGKKAALQGLHRKLVEIHTATGASSLDGAIYLHTNFTSNQRFLEAQTEAQLETISALERSWAYYKDELDDEKYADGTQDISIVQDQINSVHETINGAASEARAASTELQQVQDRLRKFGAACRSLESRLLAWVRTLASPSSILERHASLSRSLEREGISDLHRALLLCELLIGDLLSSSSKKAVDTSV